MITFQREKWQDCVEEMRPLWPGHYEELALNRDVVQLACDEEKFAYGESIGCLHVVTARVDGQLVGYYYGALTTHLHYKDSGLMCTTDAYYLRPEFRSGTNGILFIDAILKSLKERGAVKLYISTKVHQDNGKLFEAFGMACTDRIFTKVL